MEDKWSYSKLIEYQICPRLYRFVWIEKKAPPELPDAIVRGLRVHESISRILRNESSLTNELETLKEVGAQAVRCLQNWYREHSRRRREIFIGTEVPFEAEIDGYQFVGRVDAIFKRSNGTVVIEDFKTGQRRVDRELLQMLLYYALTRSCASKLLYRWSYLSSGETFTRTNQELGRSLSAKWAEIRREIERIRADSEFKPKISSLCSQCPYRTVCEVVGMRKPTREEVKAASLPPWKTIDVGETLRVELVSDLYWIEEGEEDLLGRICPWSQYQIRVHNLSKGGKEQVLLGPGVLYSSIVDAIEKAGGKWGSDDFFRGRVVVISRPDKNTFIVECEKEKKVQKAKQK